LRPPQFAAIVLQLEAIVLHVVAIVLHFVAIVLQVVAIVLHFGEIVLHVVAIVLQLEDIVLQLEAIVLQLDAMVLQLAAIVLHVAAIVPALIGGLSKSGSLITTSNGPAGFSGSKLRTESGRESLYSASRHALMITETGSVAVDASRPRETLVDSIRYLPVLIEGD
jgi:hypothetical protein